MEIFKYIPGFKFREVTASASVYLALGELFALGEFSRWLINIFRPLSRKLWEVLISYLPFDLILSIKEKDALTALLLFLPLGFVGFYRLLFSSNRGNLILLKNSNITVFAIFFAWIIFLILLFDVIILEQHSQHDGFKLLLGIEVLKYLSPMVFSLYAILGLILFLPAKKLDGIPIFISRLISYTFVGISCFFVATFPMRYPGLLGAVIFLILIFIIVSVRYCPRSYVTIVIITALMVSSSFMVDFLKSVILLG